MKVDFKKNIRIFTSIYIFIALILPYFLNLNFFVIEILFIIYSIITLIIFSQKIRLNKTSRVWLIPLGFSLISTAFSINVWESLKYCILILFLIIMVSFVSLGVQEKKTIMMIVCCTGIHVFFSVWQYLEPSSFYSVFSLFATPNTLEANQSFFYHGRICGITEQTGVNGFILSLFLIIIFQKFLVDKRITKKIWLAFCLIISFFMLLLTGKRSFFIAILLVFCCIWFFYAESISMKRRIVFVFFSIVLISIVLSVAIDNDLLSPIVSKFQFMKDSGDISNGRIGLWLQTLEIYKKNPIVGIGANCTKLVINNNSHNIYLELLADFGLFGAISFYVAIIYPYIDCCKLIIIHKKVESVIIFAMAFQTFFIIYGFVGNPLFDHKMMWIYIFSLILYENFLSTLNSPGD